MRKDFTIGLVVPFATDTVPDEGLQMYPGVRFIPRGVGVRSLTPQGYDSACEAILPAAEYLATQNVDAIMVIGTSLTFYRGSDFHDQLLEKLRATTGLPVSTMSQAVVDGLRAFDARRIVVATAYADDVNDRLKDFSRPKASRCWCSKASACSVSASPATRARLTSSRSARKCARRRRKPRAC